MPKIYAHRGASGDRPENTISAFQESWKQGADGVECDIHLTADGRLVVSHDPHTGRVADKKWAIAEKSWEELQTLDVGKWKGEKFAGERIPLLSKVLDDLPPEKEILIEVKSGVAVIPVLAQLLGERKHLLERVTVMAFDSAVVRLAAAELSGVLPMLLIAFKNKGAEWEPSGPGSVAMAVACGARGIGWQCCAAIDEHTVEVARAAGLQLSSWTVNAPADALRLARLGLDGLTTDWPARIRDALSEGG